MHFFRSAIVGALSTLLGLGSLFLACDRPPMRMGQQVEVGGASFSVKGVTFLDQLTSDMGEDLLPRGDGVFALVDLQVDHQPGTPLPFQATDFALRIAGRDAAIPPTLVPEAPMDLHPLGDAASSDAKVFRIPFIVPRGAALSRLLMTHPAKREVSLQGQVATPAARGPLPKVGALATAGGISCQVHAVSFPEVLKDGLFSTRAKPGQKLCFLDVTVKNEQREPSFQVNPLFLILEDAAGKRFKKGGLDLGFSQALDLATLKPGESTRGKLLISVDKDSDITKLRYKVGVLGAPLEIALK